MDFVFQRLGFDLVGSVDVVIGEGGEYVGVVDWAFNATGWWVEVELRYGFRART